MNNNTKCLIGILMVMSFLMYLTLPVTDYVLYETQQLNNLKIIEKDKSIQSVFLDADSQPDQTELLVVRPSTTAVHNFTSEINLKQDRKPFYHKKEPIILIWSYLYNLQSEGPNPGKTPGGCQLSNDKRDLENASAVLFEYTSLDGVEFPWQHYRHQEQIYVARFEESPRTMKLWFKYDLEKFGNGFINWTMTYRRDADVFCPYMSWNNIKIGSAQEEHVKIENIISQKSKVALWVVSNCGSGKSSGAFKRMEFVNRLSQLGMRIDKFGKCFENKDEFSRLTEEQLNSYKFYVAFENSLHCRDYVTEKFWRNALSLQRVPIVWGPSREDMEELAPKGSYVFAEDFASEKELVDHVMYLDGNDTAYAEYFRWRTDEESGWKEKLSRWSLPYCQNILCDRLKEQIGSPKSKSIGDMNSFWYGSERRECME